MPIHLSIKSNINYDLHTQLRHGDWRCYDYIMKAAASGESVSRTTLHLPPYTPSSLTTIMTVNPLRFIIDIL